MIKSVNVSRTMSLFLGGLKCPLFLTRLESVTVISSVSLLKSFWSFIFLVNFVMSSFSSSAFSFGVGVYFNPLETKCIWCALSSSFDKLTTFMTPSRLAAGSALFVLVFVYVFGVVKWLEHFPSH